MDKGEYGRLLWIESWFIIYHFYTLERLIYSVTPYMESYTKMSSTVDDFMEFFREDKIKLLLLYP